MSDRFKEALDDLEGRTVGQLQVWYITHHNAIREALQLAQRVESLKRKTIADVPKGLCHTPEFVYLQGMDDAIKHITPPKEKDHE